MALSLILIFLCLEVDDIRLDSMYAMINTNTSTTILKQTSLALSF